ncbi:MAG: class I mannose-6-phosphate isomerase [Planctomycetes bacterium]|nr:class I mannose-6-phosphate isomerase [Planctomycetota bacterium]
MPYPLVLGPRLLEKPWGGRRIETVLGRALPAGQRIGESWEVYDRDGGSSVVLNGPLAGRTLASLRGDTPFPFIVKILDAAENLSVQVHPDAAAAARLGGEAKTECWFVLHAEPGAKVFRGLRSGVTKEELAAALANGSVETCLHSFEVTMGDTVFVPAGTVHTIGRGVLLAEVQQNSDTTYRMFDWGRPREIHVREALDSIHFGPRSPDKIPAQLLSDDGQLARLLMIQCPYFTVDSIEATGTFTLDVEPSPTGVPAVLHVFAGEGELRPFRRGVSPVGFTRGTTILLPTRDLDFELASGATVVRAMLFRG